MSLNEPRTTPTLLKRRPNPSAPLSAHVRQLLRDKAFREEAGRQYDILRSKLLEGVRSADLNAVNQALEETRIIKNDVSSEYAVARQKLWDWTSDNSSILLEAAYKCGNEKITHAVIYNCDAKLPMVGSERWSAVLTAIVESQGMESMSNLLMEKVQQRDKNKGFLECARQFRINEVKFYLLHGAEIDWKDSNEQTALVIAVENRNADFVRVLLDSGASLDQTKRDGRTVFEIALKNLDEKVLRLLLARHRKEDRALDEMSIQLDLNLQKHDILSALKFLQQGCSVALRAMTNVCKTQEEQIIGKNNEYLKTLCSNIMNIGKDLKLRNDPASRHTGSEEHFLHATRWLLDCLTKHVNCIKVERGMPALPTRVIDVGPPDGSMDPVLLISNSRKGRYVALSHRWGSSDIKKTTKSNLEARLEGMNFSDLTKTMQDAVTITRRLGVRYLWIDAICIIQDSHSDWSDEASNMADVYRNALLTISAAAASDHSQGCFASTEVSGPGGELSTRGWILQEELLSPRTLEYGFGVLKWECITRTLSSDEESKIQNEGSSVPKEQARLKRALWGFRSTSMTLEQQAYTSWQHMVMSYSRRVLTDKSDKIMAIMGIATSVERTVDDIFFAGLWQRRLYHDLLWTSEGDSKNRIESIDMPSWSWISLDGYVSYTKWPEGSTPLYMKSMLNLISAQLEAGENGPICRRLIIEGDLQKVSRGTSEKGDCLYIVSRSKVEELNEEQELRNSVNKDRATDRELEAKMGNVFIKEDVGETKRHSKATGRFWQRNQWRSKYTAPENLSSEPPESDEEYPVAQDQKPKWVSAQLWPDIKLEEFNEAWVFPVAQDQCWLHCIVLVEVDGVDEEVEKGDLRRKKRFRRVGRCHVSSLSKNYFFAGIERIEFELV